MALITSECAPPRRVEAAAAGVLVTKFIESASKCSTLEPGGINSILQ